VKSVCVPYQVVVLELLLMLEEQVVHLPEFPLGGGRLGCLRGRRGARMHSGQREVAKTELETFSEMLSQGLDDLVRAAAVGALIVAVLEQRRRRRSGPDDVIASRDRK
jgi:hypothetical protein